LSGREGAASLSVRVVCECAAEQSVAPDRAAILGLRDTTPLQAARQVDAVVRPFFLAVRQQSKGFAQR
jgi:hypothetical protein